MLVLEFDDWIVARVYRCFVVRSCLRLNVCRCPPGTTWTDRHGLEARWLAYVIARESHAIATAPRRLGLATNMNPHEHPRVATSPLSFPSAPARPDDPGGERLSIIDMYTAMDTSHRHNRFKDCTSTPDDEASNTIRKSPVLFDVRPGRLQKFPQSRTYNVDR